jgi:hypothetical protein
MRRRACLLKTLILIVGALLLVLVVVLNVVVFGDARAVWRQSLAFIGLARPYCDDHVSLVTMWDNNQGVLTEIVHSILSGTSFSPFELIWHYPCIHWPSFY